MTSDPNRWLPYRPGNARGRATAARITAAALDLAEQRGVPAITIDEICRVAGCSRRTFFHHFPNREVALLGSALPRIDPAALPRYVAGSGGLLTGAIGMVEIPDELRPTSPLGARRHRLIGSFPDLQVAAQARLAPIATDVRQAVAARLIAADVEPSEAARLADLVTLLASAVMLHAHGSGDDPLALLAGLQPVWGQLLG